VNDVRQIDIDDNGVVVNIPGSVMRKRLDDEDRRAVDLLFERANGIGDVPVVEQLFRAPVGGGFERRIDNVETLLQLLDYLPAEDPPADLVTQTLARIQRFQAEVTPDLLPGALSNPGQRPHA
jgi:hypothetical protein